MKLGENIKSLREKQGMSLEDIGKQISVSRSTVMRYESGAIQHVTCDKVIELADVLGCTPQHLMGWEDEFADGNADLVNEIISDSTLAAHMRQLTRLGPKHRQTIYDMIDYWQEKEGSQDDAEAGS